MPFDGNGNWTSNYNAESDRDAGYKILASRFDNILLADLAQSFENCLTKDTQVKPQQNFNANNYRLINVADPVDDKDAVNKQTMESAISTADATAVHLAGDETITGDKTFSGAVSLMGSVSAGSTVKETIIKWGMPDYSSGVSKSVSGFTADSDGWLSIVTGTIVYGVPASVSVNGSVMQYAHAAGTTSIQVSDMIPIRKGDVITASNIQTLWFYKCMGE